MVTGAFNLFYPEVAIDGHEKFPVIMETGESLCTDMELQTGAGSLNHPAVMTELVMKMALAALEKGRDLGLRGHFYTKLASAAGGYAGSSYCGTRNCLSILVETPGQLHLGMNFMERRVIAHYILAATIIDYTVEHAQEVMETVRASREYMAATGAVYDENKVIVLEQGKGPTGYWATPLIHVPTGEVMDPMHQVAYDEHVVALRTRPRPTAYVVPKGTANEEEILRIANSHAIGHYLLSKGSAVKLQRYIQKDTAVTLTEECTVCFEQGAYVFPNTVPSTVLGAIMEPDFYGERKNMTLLSMGVIQADENGSLPIYRHCHSLQNGKVVLETG